jgi:hypothetical protein
MKSIDIKIYGHTRKSPEEICAELLDTERWSDFKGYSILPGIEQACFELRTQDVVGSRIRVKNTDGSSHVEEIIEWDVQKKVVLRFQDFSPPLKHLATHFIETWTFSRSDTGTKLSRSMSMYPKGWAGWLMLLPISRLMKKAFEVSAEQSEVT